MKKIAIIAADETEFFARGKRLAALADAGKPIPSESVISFGDPADLLNGRPRHDEAGEPGGAEDEASGGVGLIYDQS